MADERESQEPITPSEGLHLEALSVEVLKLKIDDLFQEVESLKRRVALLEDQPGHTPASSPEGADQAPGTGTVM